MLLTGEKSIAGLVSLLGLSVNRAAKVQIHSILQFFAVLCYVAGFLAIYQHKNDQSKQHFTSWHSCMYHQ